MLICVFGIRKVLYSEFVHAKIVNRAFHLRVLDLLLAGSKMFGLVEIRRMICQFYEYEDEYLDSFILATCDLLLLFPSFTRDFKTKHFTDIIEINIWRKFTTRMKVAFGKVITWYLLGVSY